jgi:hypothetical protein
MWATSSPLKQSVMTIANSTPITMRSSGSSTAIGRPRVWRDRVKARLMIPCMNTQPLHTMSKRRTILGLNRRLAMQQTKQRGFGRTQSLSARPRLTPRAAHETLDYILRNLTFHMSSRQNFYLTNPPHRDRGVIQIKRGIRKPKAVLSQNNMLNLAVNHTEKNTPAAHRHVQRTATHTTLTS